MRRPKRNGWQFTSERVPSSVVARTWAKIRREVVALQMLERLEEFQAGVVEVKMQGWCGWNVVDGGLVLLVVVVVEEEMAGEGSDG